MEENRNTTGRQQDKRLRLQVIRMIVGNNPIETQEELAIELDKAGFPSTQTTLSRDLRQLRISKVRTRSGKSVYALPGSVQFDPVPTREELNESRWYVRNNGALFVVHTPPGHASIVAYDIDECKSSLILGTVAGDDTVLVIAASGVEEEEIMKVLCDAVPRLKKHGR